MQVSAKECQSFESNIDSIIKFAKNVNRKEILVRDLFVLFFSLEQTNKKKIIAENKHRMCWKLANTFYLWLSIAWKKNCSKTLSLGLCFVWKINAHYKILHANFFSSEHDNFKLITRIFFLHLFLPIYGVYNPEFHLGNHTRINHRSSQDVLRVSFRF